MWKFVFQRGVKNWWRWAAAKLGSRPCRRQRRFAGAEPLESRALLSATAADSSLMLPHENSPPATEAIFSIGNMDADSIPAMVGIERGLSVGLGLGEHFAEPQFPFGMTDVAFEAIAQSSPNQRTPAFGRDEVHRPSSDLFASLTERSVEVRFAESGQVVAAGKSSSVQDSNGLTVSDDSAPTTYLHATDADGRTYSRLVFITRTIRSVPNSEPQPSDDASGAVVAEAELSDESVAEDLATRPDLHDLETALDSANDAATSPSSEREDKQPLLAATTRTLRTNSTRVATPKEYAASTARDAVTSTRPISAEGTTIDSDAASDDLFAAPVFDPTTRNVVLSVCVLGALARANARRRRRQKVALAQ